jgi:hypothetical protein
MIIESIIERRMGEGLDFGFNNCPEVDATIPLHPDLLSSLQL